MLRMNDEKFVPPPHKSAGRAPPFVCRSVSDFACGGWREGGGDAHAGRLRVRAMGADDDEAVLHENALAKLRNAVAERWQRVSDVFNRWDEDGSGEISRNEFVKIVATLVGEGTTKEEAALLFDFFDADGSGMIEYRELYSKLRPGATVELDEKLQAGAAGAISLSVGNKYALRKDGPQTHKSRVLYGGAPMLTLGEGADFAQQLSNALVGSWSRVRDLWAEWDEDMSGHVDRTEFYRALCLFGLACTRAESDDLFHKFDGVSRLPPPSRCYRAVQLVLPRPLPPSPPPVSLRT